MGQRNGAGGVVGGSGFGKNQPPVILPPPRSSPVLSFLQAGQTSGEAFPPQVGRGPGGSVMWTRVCLRGAELQGALGYGAQPS